jgi:hypothetical protein
MGHSRPSPAGRRSSHVRYAPKATVGHQNAIGRDGPQPDSSWNAQLAAKQIEAPTAVGASLSVLVIWR